MGWPVMALLLSLAFPFPLSSSTLDAKSGATSLSVEKPEEALKSPNGVFSAGFYSVGDNAFYFAIWFSNSRTIVWMANRDQPINGKRSKLSLLKTGNLILTDAGKFTVWATNTVSISLIQLSLCNTGNLVLRNMEGVILWESFDFPTDTLLPQQLLTKNTKLVSLRSQGIYHSGFYELFFDNDNVLRLLYNGLEISIIYWPDPWLASWEAGRNSYNNSRLAVLSSLGNFSSSDGFNFMSSDYGAVLHRRLTVDYDGNIRLNSWEEERQTWVVSWQAIQTPCNIHFACGANSLCSYAVSSGRKCSCLPGYKMKTRTDWAYGCEPEFGLSCDKNEFGFMLLSHVEFYGYDYGFHPNYSFDQCWDLCLQLCDCKAFQYSFKKDTGCPNCYLKTLLLNGYQLPSFSGDLFSKVPQNNIFSYAKPIGEFNLNCTSKFADRSYVERYENGTVKFMLWFASGVAGLEVICIFVVWCLLNQTQKRSGVDKQGYALCANKFRNFTYAELKKATKSFTEEIGRGAGGIVYKGVLNDNRVVAIKRLNEANQGEDEFLAEVSIIGGLTT